MTDQYVSELLRKHSANGLLLDTNLLLMFAVGTYDLRRIENFKRTASYAQIDFQRLTWIAKQFTRFWRTPNILTEVDNLGRQLPRNEWPGFASSLSRLALTMTEAVVESADAMKRNVFSQLGLADTITIVTNAKFLLMSDDLKLCLTAPRFRVDAVNFNHIRFT